MGLTVFVYGFFFVAAILYLFSLWRSYQVAKQLNVPLLLFPISTHNLFWLIFSVPLRGLFERFFPEAVSSYLGLGIYGHEFRQGSASIRGHGPVWALVTPTSVELWSAFPELTVGILGRPSDFPLAASTVDILSICGPNLASVNGEDWQRQRRIIAPLINERVSEMAWEESVAQAKEMVSNHVSAKSGVTDSSLEGLQRIAINVLGSVAYGQSRSWNVVEEEVVPGYKLTFMSSLLTITSHFVIAGFVSNKLLLSSLMPAWLQQIGHAKVEFPIHARNMATKERARTGEETAARPTNLLQKMTSLADENMLSSKIFLRSDEIVGNLFQFTLAGYDTTANTMAYAITLLAIHWRWQAWISEEIAEASQAGSDYGTLFPRLRRCVALMYETLRLYSPIGRVERVCRVPRTIVTSLGTHRILPGVLCYASPTLTHLNQALWGDDADEFKPSRWILADGSLLEPERGSFMPWSVGSRACPGMKISIVEFVAVFYTIFKSSRVEPEIFHGEVLPDARKRLMAVLVDSQPIVTLQINKPKEIVLRWNAK